MGFQVGSADRCCWNAELLVPFSTTTSVFPKLRQERLKAITKSIKAGEQILLYYTVSKPCLLTNNPDLKGRSSCYGHTYEQTRSTHGAQSTEWQHMPLKLYQAVLELSPWPEQPFGALSENECPRRGQWFPSRCFVVVFVAFHIYCITE